MPLSLKEAHELQPGDQLTFGTDYTYEVVSVEPQGNGVYLTLKRDDGYATTATHHDLDVATKVTPIVPDTDTDESTTDADKPVSHPTPHPSKKQATSTAHHRTTTTPSHKAKS